MIDWKKVGKAFQRAREDAGLDQDEAGEVVGKARPGGRVTISRWENGKNAIPMTAAVKLAARYGKTLPELGLGTDGSASEPLDNIDVPHGTSEIGDDSWSPNPALVSKIPKRAYDVALAYCRRLQSAHWPKDEIEQIERLMVDPRYAQANKRKGVELSEDDHIMLIDATWEAVKHTAAALGRQV